MNIKYCNIILSTLVIKPFSQAQLLVDMVAFSVSLVSALSKPIASRSKNRDWVNCDLAGTE